MSVATDVVREFKGSVVESGKEFTYDHPFGKALARTAEARAVAAYYREEDPVTLLRDYNDSLVEAYQIYNADQVLIDFPGGIDGQVASGVVGLETAVNTIPGIVPEMVPIVLNRAKDRIADKRVDNWLQSGSADSLEQMLTAAGASNDESMATRIRATAEKKLIEKFESHKKSFEAGLMSESEFEGLITSTTNPHLKTLLEKYWNTDETRAKKKKESEFTTKSDPLVTAFEGEFEGIEYAGDRVNFESLTEMVENAPGYASLPDPVQKAVEISMKHGKKKGELGIEIDELSKKEAEGKESLARLEKTRLLTRIWSKRLAFIAGGVLVGGLIGASGIPAITGLLGGADKALLISGGIGGLLGIALGGSADSKFSKAGIEQRNALIGLDKKIKQEELNVVNIENGFVKKDISAQVAYTKLAARLAALANNLDAEAMVDKYLKKTNLGQLEAILA